MGFRDLECFNVALLAKQGWRIIQNPDSLVAQILKEKYHPNDTFLDAPLSKKSSYVWRSIWNAKKLLNEGLVWRVGNGRRIKIWGDKWLFSPTTYAIQSPINTLTADARVCELIDQDSQWWNIALIKDIFLEEDVAKICSLAISPRTQQDRMVWAGNKNGVFSVRSAYHLAKDLNSRHDSGCSGCDSMTPLWKRIWKISGPRVIPLFLWQACNNILPTNENLFKRRITTDPLCPICQMEVETVGHVLWSCPAARDVWMEGNIRFQKSCSEEDNFSSIILRLRERLTEEDFDLMACLARQIWLRRNKMVFEDKFSHPKLVFKAACDQLEFHKQACQGVQGVSQLTRATGEVTWQPPPRGISKLNWDAAIAADRKLMGIGVIARDYEGRVLATQCLTKPYVRDSGVAEAMALRAAVVLMEQLGITQAILAGDCLEVVQAVKTEESSLARYGPILEDTKELLKVCNYWDICHVRRTSNEAAHRLAKLAVSQNLNKLWIQTVPPCIEEIVMAETIFVD